MSFLTDNDWGDSSVQVRNEVLQVLLISTLSRTTAENMAQEEISGYLRPRGVDVNATFATVGAARNPFLIMRMIDIALYHLHSNTPARVVPKHREDRYNAAVTWMGKLNLGELDHNFPLIADTTPPGDDAEDNLPTLKLGSNRPYSSRW